MHSKNTETHNRFMQHALRLAKQAKFNKHNLKVGCVIVKNNNIIAEGLYNSVISKNHAEVNAINNAKESIEGSSIYITLEPCSHIGKTPPCVDNLIKRKVKEVVIPFKDPNPLVNGKSIAKLKNAGIKVITNILTEECYQLNQEFLYFYLEKKPLVTIKWAESLDGKLCTYNYHSKWISSESARNQAHYLRRSNSAILIGVNTLLLDNPLLNIRYNIDHKTTPIRIILSGNSKVNTHAKIWDDKSANNWLIIPTNYVNDNNIKLLKDKGVIVIPIKKNNDNISFLEILKELGKRDISSLLVEGGANTIAKVLEERLANKIELFIAPLILGGHMNIANFINENFNSVAKAERFKIVNNKLLEDTLWLSLLNISYLDIIRKHLKILTE